MSSFGKNFVGSDDALFQRYLAETAELRVYNREILVIQSSGSGKTRIVTQALKQNIGVLFQVCAPGGRIDIFLLRTLTTTTI